MTNLKSAIFDYEYHTKVLTDICLPAYYLQGTPHAEVKCVIQISDDGKLFAVELTILAENGTVAYSDRKEFGGQTIGLSPSRMKPDEQGS